MFFTFIFNLNFQPPPLPTKLNPFMLIGKAIYCHFVMRNLQYPLPQDIRKFIIHQIYRLSYWVRNNRRRWRPSMLDYSDSEHIIAIETTDKMTDGQIAAKAREYFHK